MLAGYCQAVGLDAYFKFFRLESRNFCLNFEAIVGLLNADVDRMQQLGFCLEPIVKVAAEHSATLLEQLEGAA